MNAVPRRINARVLRRPQYARYDLVRGNREAEWVAANLPLIRQWWRDLNEADRGKHFDPELEFQTFCGVQWDFERMHYEQLKADGFDDPYAREE